MDFMYQMISVIEVILINLSLFSMNTKTKYSWKRILPLFVAYSLILIPIGIVAIKSLGIYGNGNALFTLFGFFYLLPIHYVFEGTTKKHFHVICFCWVYTLLVASIAIHLGFILETYGRPFMTLLIETILFLTTFHFVRRFVKNVYMPLLQCQGKKIQNYLDRASLVWFLTILLMNLQFVFLDLRFLKLFTLTLLGLNIIYHFQLIYEVLKQDNAIGTLENQVTRDTLTCLGNRLGFAKEFDEKIKTENNFTLIYCDLDNFKSVNDIYGHTNGDVYLKEFASYLQSFLGGNCAFRISGDEFAIFVSNRKLHEVSYKLEHIEFKDTLPFIGVSYGYAQYPMDGLELRELVEVADQNMYENKQKKKCS